MTTIAVVPKDAVIVVTTVATPTAPSTVITPLATTVVVATPPVAVITNAEGPRGRDGAQGDPGPPGRDAAEQEAFDPGDLTLIFDNALI